MDSNIKMAAQRLMKLADSIEKEASEKTYFVCDCCNHTASLSDINQKRSSVAKGMGIEHVASVTVDDKISCPACDGKMSYVATEDSMKYYMEAEEEPLLPPVDQESEEETETETPEGLEVDKEEEKSIFDPVDEQDKKDDEEGDDEIDLSFEGEAPEEDAPLEDDSESETDEDSAVIEEEVPEEKPKSDKPDDEKATYPKRPSPKFEKMPKGASEEMQRAIMKYASCLQ